MAWDKRQVKAFAFCARKRVGDAWRFIGPSMREALVAAEVLHVVTSQVAETVRVEDVQKLHNDVREALKAAIESPTE